MPNLLTVVISPVNVALNDFCVIILVLEMQHCLNMDFLNMYIQVETIGDQQR